MGPLTIGAILSCKYRIDRLSHEIGGVLFYDATDTERARSVCVKIVRREVLANADAFAPFQSGAHDPSVIDFGIASGLPFYVTTECDVEEDEVTINRQMRVAI